MNENRDKEDKINMRIRNEKMGINHIKIVFFFLSRTRKNVISRISLGNHLKTGKSSVFDSFLFPFP